VPEPAFGGLWSLADAPARPRNRHYDPRVANDVTDAWRENAADWLAWARAPGHDAAFWELNLPALELLLPSADRLPAQASVVDVGCGEGRVGRILAERGYLVRGLDASPLLAGAAGDAGGFEEVVVGDAISLPWPDDHFDLALAFMTLMDMPDAVTAVREIARVLKPGGWLCVAVVHPFNEPLDAEVDYFEGHRFDEAITRHGLTMRFVGHDRPLSYYTGALSGAGFVIEELREPRPDPEWPQRHPEMAVARRMPFFLHVRARLE
jgi:SAM-dependent methyltransferase